LPGWQAVADPHPSRQAALVARLLEHSLDGLLVTSLPNIRYLTGFSGSSALLFLTATDTWFLTDPRYETQVAQEVRGASRLLIESVSLWDGLWAQFRQRSGTSAFGFESAHLTHRDFARLLDAGARWTWRPTLDLVEDLRMRKEPDEVEAIRLAGVIATSALERTLAELRVGLTETQGSRVRGISLLDHRRDRRAHGAPTCAGGGASYCARRLPAVGFRGDVPRVLLGCHPHGGRGARFTAPTRRLCGGAGGKRAGLCHRPAGDDRQGGGCACA
jgi:hypothetical protein